MQFIPNLPYPDQEKPKLAALESLFQEWHQHFVSNGSPQQMQQADEMVLMDFTRTISASPNGSFSLAVRHSKLPVSITSSF